MQKDLKSILGVDLAAIPSAHAIGQPVRAMPALWEEELRQEMGVDSEALARTPRIKQALYGALYSTTGEICIFVVILASVALLVCELALPTTHPAGSLGDALTAPLGVFFWLDIGFSVFFLVEYALKLWIAPRKWYFIKTHWIDLLALLPVLRVFKIGSAVRLLRLLRLLRVLRIARLFHQKVATLSHDMQRRNVENLIVGTYLAFALLFGTLGILIFEKEVNPHFETLGDGLWWCVVTLTTVGYGDMTPVTVGGKVVAGVIMFTGLSFYALLTGLLSRVLIERSMREGMHNVDIASMEGHVVVCGWNETGRKLVSHLIESPHTSHIVVLDHEETAARLFHPKVYYMSADASTGAGLDAARTAFCSVAVVLSHATASSQDADARAILTVLAIEQLNGAIHTIAELMSEENVYHVKNAGCDEVIVQGAYTGTLLSQAVRSPGVTDVFGKLFSSEQRTQMVELELSAHSTGESFSALSRTCFLAGRGIALGYRRHGVLHMAPDDDVRLQASDRMVLLTRQQPNS